MARVLETPLDRVTPPQIATRNQGPLIAVDLGTTNLRIAAFHQGRAVPLVASRQRTPPSVIAVGTRGSIVVGQSAEQQAASNPELAVWGIKHLIGGRYQSPQVQALKARLACTLFEGPNGQTGVQLADRTFSARELVAMLLHEARQRAQEILGQPVYRAVIVVPARKDESFREFMQHAATLAGLHLAGTVPAPAAAIAFARLKTAGTVGVFDWGGGGFEFSVVKNQPPKPELVATDSDPTIGGAEVDAQVLAYLLSALDEDHPLRQELTPATHFRLLAAAERAKCLLTTQDSAPVRVPFIGDMASGQSFEATLRRDELAQIVEPFLVRAMQHCEQVLDSRSIFPGELSDVILAGELTAIPAVRDRLRAYFSDAQVFADQPGNAVVLGACMTAQRSLEAAGAAPRR